MGLVSKQCVNFVKEFEGFYPRPYFDIVGVKTLGYGMTGKEIKGLSYVTEAQASKMLENLLNNKYALPIKQDLDRRGVNLTQNQFDALVSMAYNVGTGGVLGSTLYRNICNGIRDRKTITSNFEMWCKAGGKTVYGLLRRRRREADMFFGSGNSANGNSYSYSKPTAVVTASALNVREKKSTSSKILGVLSNRKSVEVYRIEGDWVHIYYPPHGGFVSKQYVKLYNVPNSMIQRPNKPIKKEEEKKMDIILYYGFADEYCAKALRDKLKLPVLSLADFKANGNLKKNTGKVYMVGGQEKPVANTVLISGNGREDTMIAVVNYIKKLK